jgi:hypothetical protein
MARVGSPQGIAIASLWTFSFPFQDAPTIDIVGRYISIMGDKLKDSVGKKNCFTPFAKLKFTLLELGLIDGMKEKVD